MHESACSARFDCVVETQSGRVTLRHSLRDPPCRNAQTDGTGVPLLGADVRSPAEWTRVQHVLPRPVRTLLTVFWSVDTLADNPALTVQPRR